MARSLPLEFSMSRFLTRGGCIDRGDFCLAQIRVGVFRIRAPTRRMALAESAPASSAGAPDRSRVPWLRVRRRSAERDGSSAHRWACPWSDCECQPALQHEAPNAPHACRSGAWTERTLPVSTAGSVGTRTASRTDRWHRGPRVIVRR